MPYSKDSYIKKDCEVCGLEFSHDPSQKNRKYCSYKCAEESRKRRITKECLECGKEFEVQEWNKDAKYCSMKCKNKHQSSDIITLNCDNCGEEFKRKEHRIRSEHNFCRHECAIEFNRGENHYEWKELNHITHEKSALKKWSKIVKERDNYTCQICGETNKDLLEAHHIKHRAENLDLRFNIDNGITLCLQCHALQHIEDPKALRLIKYKIDKYVKN